MKHCPTPNCSYYFINDEPLNICAEFNCPACRSTYCANCTKSHDKTLACTRAAEIERLDPAGSRAFNAWKSENTRPCPGCHKAIEKNEGCNHMTCSQCKHQFCWKCGRNWQDRNGPIHSFFECNQENQWWNK
jgi:ariadne-1